MHYATLRTVHLRVLLRVIRAQRKRRDHQLTSESFNDWGGRGYDDSVPGVVTKTSPSEDRTARSSIWSASLP